MYKYDKSNELFSLATQYMPGGVNSPVRAFKAVGMDPLFINNAQGSKMHDVDGNEYIDYVGSFGPLILGHSHPEIVKVITETAQKGTSYGAPNIHELELAQLVCEAIPSIEKVRMVNSGTEATMSAIRLARAYTSKNKIIKFEGCYHGHADSFLIKAGSGLLTSGIPISPGVPIAHAENTLVANYNDLESVEKLFEQYKNDIAAIIVEPVAANMGLVLPDLSFLQGLRKISELNGSLLIFDEVITGFRVCYGGFQDVCNIKPDLTTLGKIIGGGLPVGAYGGKKEIMDLIAPEGDVYQAGTLSGNPLAMAAGSATLNILKDRDWYDRLEVMGHVLNNKLETLLESKGLFYEINRLGSMFSIFFSEQEINNYADVMTSDTEKHAMFYRELLKQGVYFPPAQFETCFISCAHDLEDIEKTVTAIDIALNKVV
ncbi:MAG TPA: glutamate-1-semialdehyde 2,1-aminomutase [Syntrophomonadaceae bacterium]|nr:glutamate-1-semialdehyde 2,1-aminomutase [Syntrophomonadaceae bacterium]